jgi:protein gp37
MGQTSAIEWTEATWNPWHGCLKVSPGCAHCYMYRDKRRFGQDPAVVVRSKTGFDSPKKWSSAKMIFTCSWSDFFLEAADQWRAEAWDVIRQSPQHTYQILTKRPERISEHLPAGWPFRNVWLGVSVENPRFYHRIEALRIIPASIRFLSLEPLLSSMSSVPLEGISWVVVGGESGPGCRPMKPEWVREIRERCSKKKVAFFFKQWGGARKDIAGRVLDGKTWNAMPELASEKKRRTSATLSRLAPAAGWF